MSDDVFPTVLLPGAGGPAAICALKSLRMAGFRGKIVSTDADPLSPGLFLADASCVLPPISDPQFFDRALELIERERVSLILATSGFDTLVYSQRKPDLERRGVLAIVSDWPAVDSCVDKWKFYELAGDRFPVPRTVLDPRGGVGFPCFVKPRRSKGSRGIARCDDAAALERQLESRNDLLIQEYLPGEEYSIDVLSDLAGNPIVAVPRLRLATREGISVRGRVFHDPDMQRVCMDLARTLGLKGPSCMQMKRAASGEAKFTEVNPRMGGSTIFATLAGVNLAKLQLDLAAGRRVEVPPFREITVSRYYDEIVVVGA